MPAPPSNQYFLFLGDDTAAALTALVAIADTSTHNLAATITLTAIARRSSGVGSVVVTNGTQVVIGDSTLTDLNFTLTFVADTTNGGVGLNLAWSVPSTDHLNVAADVQFVFVSM